MRKLGLTASLFGALALTLLLQQPAHGQLPTLPPPEKPTCECLYEPSNICRCGPGCSLEAEDVVDNCTEAGRLQCTLYCRSTGFDECRPLNCFCEGCNPSVTNPKTAIDSAKCMDACRNDGCTGNSTYKEALLAKCTGPGDEGVPQDSGGPTCFPENALVELEDGRKLSMRDLHVGQRVLAANLSGQLVFSDVFGFTHRDSRALTDFVQLHAATGEVLTLSRGHYVRIRGRGLQPAEKVRVASQFLTARHGWVPVVSRVSVGARGLYHPHTVYGSVVVDGVVASTYTTAMHPTLARVLLMPFKWSFTGGLSRDPLGSLLHSDNLVLRHRLLLWLLRRTL